jgi:hypothetical protein
MYHVFDLSNGTDFQSYQKIEEVEGENNEAYRCSNDGNHINYNNAIRLLKAIVKNDRR